jgi:hypothetical protein
LRVADLQRAVPAIALSWREGPADRPSRSPRRGIEP